MAIRRAVRDAWLATCVRCGDNSPGLRITACLRLIYESPISRRPRLPFTASSTCFASSAFTVGARRHLLLQASREARSSNLCECERRVDKGRSLVPVALPARSTTNDVVFLIAAVHVCSRPKIAAPLIPRTFHSQLHSPTETGWRFHQLERKLWDLRASTRFFVRTLRTRRSSGVDKQNKWEPRTAGYRGSSLVFQSSRAPRLHGIPPR